MPSIRSFRRLEFSNKGCFTTPGPLYTYDPSGNIKSIGPDDYTFDEVSRVTRGDVSGSYEAYTFDKYGNITTIDTNGSSRNLSPGATTNRLAAGSYDERGNLESWGIGACFAYDEFNMIKEVRGNCPSGDVSRRNCPAGTPRSALGRRRWL